MTTRHEKFLATGRLPDGVSHGSYSTYVNYRCHCNACKEAAQAAKIERRERAIKHGLAAVSTSKHGTQAAAANWGCTCRTHPTTCKPLLRDIAVGAISANSLQVD